MHVDFIVIYSLVRVVFILILHGEVWGVDTSQWEIHHIND